MRQTPRSTPAHALRVDFTTLWQAGIAASICFFVAWLIQAI